MKIRKAIVLGLAGWLAMITAMTGVVLMRIWPTDDRLARFETYLLDALEGCTDPLD